MSINCCALHYSATLDRLRRQIVFVALCPNINITIIAYSYAQRRIENSNSGGLSLNEFFEFC